MIDPDHGAHFRTPDSSPRLAGNHFIKIEGVVYNCVQVAMLKEKWKSDFRAKNRTDEIISLGIPDRIYEEFCRFLDKVTECRCHEKILERKARVKEFMGAAYSEDD